ncbi:MAG: M20/M25/M40 family metallo-hydrolase [Bacteroidota bacterium]|nr:M20/M25/M40 family metallo-hydrolase [Bacteroidota bacterium]
MTFRNFFFFSFLIFSAAANAQDREYAKKVIDTLASPSMHGRGYVANGDKIAAEYISDQYRSFGLTSFNLTGTYLQKFGFPVNTFPGKVEMTFTFADGEKKVCQPGEHFLVSSNSPSVKGHFKIVMLDSAIVYNETKLAAFKKLNLKKAFLLVDTIGVRTLTELAFLSNYIKYPVGVKGILVPVKPNPMADNCFKLTPWDFSQYQSTIPVIQVEYAYRAVTEIDICIGAKFFKKYNSQNVIGYIRGKVNPDSFIVFTAHYDHLGQMGKTVYFPGANDNASGVAMLLSLARYYSQPGNKPNCSIVFMAFGGEEVGLLGSHYYVEHPLFPMGRIKFLTNMDILGTGDEGITVVNATVFEPEFKKLQELNQAGNYLPLLKPRGKAAISDHHFFTEKNIPSFYIYTLGGIKAYHDTCDRSETLPLTKFEELFSLLREFTDWVDGNK